MASSAVGKILADVAVRKSTVVMLQVVDFVVVSEQLFVDWADLPPKL